MNDTDLAARLHEQGVGCEWGEETGPKESRLRNHVDDAKRLMDAGVTLAPPAELNVERLAEAFMRSDAGPMWVRGETHRAIAAAIAAAYGPAPDTLRAAARRWRDAEDALQRAAEAATNDDRLTGVWKQAGAEYGRAKMALRAALGDEP